MKRIVYFIQLWLGSLFLYSAALKLVNYAQAKKLLEPYRLFPKRVNETVGLTLPWAELAAGVSLLTGRFYPLGPIVTSVFGGCFAYTARAVLQREATVPCGCTGSDGDNVNRTTLQRAIVITVTSLGILALGRRNYVRSSTRALLTSVLLSLLPSLFAVRNKWVQAQHQKQSRERRARRIEDLTATLNRSPGVAVNHMHADVQASLERISKQPVGFSHVDLTRSRGA